MIGRYRYHRWALLNIDSLWSVSNVNCMFGDVGRDSNGNNETKVNVTHTIDPKIRGIWHELHTVGSCPHPQLRKHNIDNET